MAKMRVFVAGATGAVGAPLVRLLIRAGHSVVGTTHSPEKAEALERAGAESVVVDGLNGTAMKAAIVASRPDVVVHQMTALRGMTDLRAFDRVFSESNRLRTEGLDHILAAAAEAGTRRIVVQSFCGWPYARTGALVKSEADPLDPDPPAQFRRTLDAIRYLERATTASKLEGIVLRYGAFYGPDTGILDPALLNQLRSRRFPLIGDGDGWWSFVHVDDAARAVVTVVECGEPGIYNIVDDEPAPVRTWLPALAAMVGAKPPRRVPKWLARILTGDHLVTIMTEARAGSNAKAKCDLGWKPVEASWRHGFATALQRKV